MELGTPDFQEGVVVTPEPDAAQSVYDAVGRQEFFDHLVDRFYEGVAEDPVLRSLYPKDLGPSRRRLAGFLAQYWGGPPHYSAERGHPRLWMRHAPFEIGVAERDAWMHHMRSALDEVDLPGDIRSAMLDYFESAATHLINKQPPAPPSDTRKLPLRQPS
ncbi:globin [Candidatus Poriferisocius sp.]|uniref:globin domain-containing protein n=1 Tax=Candidatus Poriferisocius sp. TaxID=3101276 RepID=UPI003B02C0B9